MTMAEGGDTGAVVRAGVAKVGITPPVGTWQAGFGARTHPCVGVRDELYARAVVLDDGTAGGRVAIVAADLIGLEAGSARRVRARAAALCGIAPGRILLSCTHTHGGPATLDLAGLGDGVTADQPIDPEYLAVAEKLLAGAVAAAARELVPVTLALGEGTAAFHVNRRLPQPSGGVAAAPNPAGAVDRRLGVLRIDPAGAPGRAPLALLYHLACHPTAMGGDNDLITADWPGQVSAFVEGAYGPTEPPVALFLQGCAGNVRPNIQTDEGRFRGATWPELADIGRAVGGEVVRVAEQVAPLVSTGVPLRLAAASTTVTLPFGAPPDRALLEATLGGSRRDRGWARAMLRQLEAGDVPQDIAAEVQALAIGPLRLVALPGEVFVEIGRRVRAALGEPTWALGYANDLSLGYVPTAAALAEGGYETVAYRFWLHPAPLGTATEDLLVAAARRVGTETDAGRR